MKIESLSIKGSWIAESPIWYDHRGYFREWFKSDDIESVIGYSFNPQQANISSSSEGTVRGIHYSLAEKGQAKWITCVSGSIRDFVVDIRPNSVTFGKWVAVELSAELGQAVLIGHGLGHAFVSLQENTTVAYLLSSPYSPNNEFEINPMDPDIGIRWGIDHEKLKISDKDKFAPSLNQRRLSMQLPS
jgi:dTDP-4-dehydrorhamnose 3,5-epimerase